MSGESRLARPGITELNGTLLHGTGSSPEFEPYVLAAVDHINYRYAKEIENLEIVLPDYSDTESMIKMAGKTAWKLHGYERTLVVDTGVAAESNRNTDAAIENLIDINRKRTSLFAVVYVPLGSHLAQETRTERIVDTLETLKIPRLRIAAENESLGFTPAPAGQLNPERQAAVLALARATQTISAH
jgi:hypothetical protein